MLIESEAVKKAFMDCLFRREEIPDGKPPADAVIVQGVMMDVGFHPGRVQEHSSEIQQWLRALSEEFHIGGSSFMNACVDRDRVQWGEQYSAEQLLCLGLAIDKVEYCLPKALWSALPGGAPYFVIKELDVDGS